MQPALAPAPHPIQASAQDNAAEQQLREHLLAQVQEPLASGAPSMESMRPSSSASPHEQNIDPAIAGSSMNMSASNDSGGEDNLDGSGKKGAKRELSTSKRAAQNRAAQRAFRQRKEGYIKKLEEQVRDLHTLEENYKAMQAENYQLRDYIINLQSRLIESQGEYPQPPSNIDLPNPRQDLSQQGAAPTASMASAIGRLQASAAEASAVADLGTDSHHDDAALLAGRVYPSKRLKNGEVHIAGADQRSGVEKVETNGANLNV